MRAETEATAGQRALLAARLRAALTDARDDDLPLAVKPSGRERFILFAGPLVRAILDGRKSVTRRLVLPQPPHKPDDPCPLGVAGDRLWVREKWGWAGQFFDQRAAAVAPFLYAADGPPDGAKYLPWKPSLHMPRAACRAVLQITASRAERLRDITAEDAVHEGCPPDRIADPIAWFRETWDHFYAAQGNGWAANPWVWVIVFRVGPDGARR